MTHDGEPDSYEYASRLATWIWEKHYKNESPHWKPLNDLLGVLTQIDNMTTGLVRAQPEQEIESDRPHAEDDGCPTEKAVLQRFWREHHAQPKQEPVAWMYDWYDETEDIDGVPIGGIVSDCISKDYDEAHSPTMGCHNIRPLYTAPPQQPEQTPQGDTAPQQEPVAAALRHAAQVVQLYDDACSDENYMIDSNDCEGILNALADYYDAGYTAPPQREWQGLTDEEIESLWDNTLSEDVGITALRKIDRAIEAKLKEKNGNL